MKQNNPNVLPDEMRIACCIICTLAEVMKDCKRCPFRIGLSFKAIKEQETQIVYTKNIEVVRQHDVRQ